jgi:tetratricopeptide (TPR) repeat protein
MPLMRRGYLITAAFVFVSTLVVYFLTMNRSIPFWDSGEFIATSNLLGIPHPPGTPLYVLIGRLFAMLPFGNVSAQLNFLSVLPSAIAVWLTFLVTVRFVRIAQATKGERTQTDEIIAWAAGACAAFFLAFSRTYWDSATEAEVYPLAEMVQILSVYLALRWWEELGDNGGDGRLLLAWYMMCLCIGIHLATFLVAPGVILLALLVNRRTLFSPRFYAWALVLGFVGLSVHYYLMVRARLNPAIDEGDPESWSAMMYMLQRKQYGSRPMFPRSTSWSFQLAMFFRYFLDQYRTWPLTSVFGSVVPMALGLYGAFMQFMREKKTFLMMLALFGVTTFGLIVYLNFTDHEVRERDYFFVTGFHFFAIWIGMGAGFVLELVRDALRKNGEDRVQPALVVACVGVVVISWLPAKTYWFENDRNGFEIAKDYAYNMLQPLAKNAFVFTNGDNDTFPLWCIQAVDHVRQDVRVVNLSLLNTDWYIRQLRDEDPKVPMTVSNDVLEQVATRGYLLDPTGQPEAVSNWMVRNIMAANHGPLEKPAYLAVTVPNHAGLDNRLKLEGLVYRVYDDTVTVRIDTTAVRRNMYEVFRYNGLFDKDGNYLDKPYKDDNAYRLTQNYAAAHLQLAFRYRLDGRRAEAIKELERILRMYPGFPATRAALGMFYLENGDTAKGLDFFAKSQKVAPNDPDLAYYHAIALGLTNQVDASAKRFDDAIALSPDDGQAYFADYSMLMDHGRRAQAADILRRWLARNPNDPQASALLQRLTGTSDPGITPPGGPAGGGNPASGGVGAP